jgi:hypothetical protein
MPRKSKGKLIYDLEFIGPKGWIKILNINSIFVPDDPDLDA